MEKIAYKIEELLQEKLSCYRQLGAILEKEREAIASINLDALWESAGYKKELAVRIEGLRAKILSIVDAEFSGMEMDVRSFSLGYLVDMLPISKKVRATLRRVKVDINTAKDNVVQQAKFNQVQVRKYIMVVDDIMSVIGDNSAQAQYTGAGTMPGQRKQNCMFRAEV
jgi:hypothetical protein